MRILIKFLLSICVFLGYISNADAQVNHTELPSVEPPSSFIINESDSFLAPNLRRRYIEGSGFEYYISINDYNNNQLVICDNWPNEPNYFACFKIHAEYSYRYYQKWRIVHSDFVYGLPVAELLREIMLKFFPPHDNVGIQLNVSPPIEYFFMSSILLSTIATLEGGSPIFFNEGGHYYKYMRRLCTDIPFAYYPISPLAPFVNNNESFSFCVVIEPFDSRYLSVEDYNSKTNRKTSSKESLLKAKMPLRGK